MTRALSLSPTISRSRLWLVLLALLTFTLQTIVTQTHIHTAPLAAGKQVPGKLDDQASCAICQVALHGGHYLTPSAISFVPLILAAFGFELPTDVAILSHSVSHSWTSRGPPRA